MTHRRQLLSAVVFTAVVCVPLGAAVARSAAKAFEVRQPDQLCTRVAGHKKAQVTPLAEGDNAWIGRLEIAPGAKVPEHRDSTEEYIHVLSGSGTMWIEGKRHDVGPGSTVYMPANAKVRFDNGKASMTAVQVFAGPAPAAKYAKWAGCP